MKLVSFFADVDNNTFYSDNAKRLRDQCERLGVDSEIVEMNFGSQWIDNVRAKPAFLLETLNRLNESFVWLDCDCDIKKPLDFNVRADWGVYLREDGSPHDFVHYVSNTQESRDFLELWINTIKEKQKGSHTAFISIFDKINSEILPEGYFSLGLAETDSKESYFQQ